mgnify:CR=1 FL=1
MELTIIIEEYYNLICEMNYLLILLNGVLEDNETIQCISDNFKHINKTLNYLDNSVDKDLNHKIINYLNNLIMFAKNIMLIHLKK